MRRTGLTFAVMQAPDGQSAAADGTDAAPEAAQEGAPANPEMPESAADQTNPNVSTDTPAEKAPETSDEQAPEPPAADDPIAPLADAVEHLTNIVESLAEQANALAARVDALEQAGNGDQTEALVAEAQRLVREALKHVAADFAGLPDKVRALEAKLKHF